MASSYKTPGVYIEELSKLPPSVAQVETAIPAFAGYTEKAEENNDVEALRDIPTKIGSLEEFKSKFGGPPEPKSITVLGEMVDSYYSPKSATIEMEYMLYHSLELFFNNGGGDCYIVSVGEYKNPASIDGNELKNGVKALAKYDEPTMIVFPDAVNLSISNYNTLIQEALNQCNKLKDRFVIMDVLGGDSASHETKTTYQIATSFRNGISSDYLKYGAAYYPFLKAILSLKFTHENLTFNTSSTSGLALSDLAPVSDSDFTAVLNALNAAKTIRTGFEGVIDIDTFKTDYVTAFASGDPKPKLVAAVTLLKDTAEALIGLVDVPDNDTTLWTNIMTILGSETSAGAKKELRVIVEELIRYDMCYKSGVFSELGVFNLNTGGHDPEDDGDTVPGGFTVPANDYVWEKTFNGTEHTDGEDYELYSIDLTALTGVFTSDDDSNEKRLTKLKPYLDALYSKLLTIQETLLDYAQEFVDEKEVGLKNTTIFQNVISVLNQSTTDLPPGGIMAGIYSRVDENRGVWKAPANVPVSGVVGPAVKITDKDQEDLNIDATAGKSINAIRAFTGKGTIVWGARTLAGNDNEWRYVPVRRFFNMVEESIKKSTMWAVFEPNDANLWVKLRAMIENYLTTLWRAGALAGATAEAAFFVKVGLNETMDNIDILEGRLNIEIGLAAVRPAEFIILKFSHKMQEA